MSTFEKKRMAARGALAALAALGVVAALAACGASPQANDTGELKTGNEQAAFDDWQRDFTACMSDEGVDMGGLASTTGGGAVGGLEDPSGESGGTTASVQAGEIDMEAYGAASKICSEKLGEMPTPPGMPSPEEMQKGMLAFAKCMREAGYDYPDPEVSKDGANSMQAMAMDEFDPQVMEDCSKESDMGFSMSSSATTGDAE
jgi:hypothetical protein